MPRHVWAGAALGAAMGTLFALGVVSLADCAGPHCARERVVGVLGHAAGGAALGALVGALILGLRRLWRGRRGRRRVSAPGPDD